MQPTTINRILVGLKRYCAWATEAGLLERDPARVVKLIPQVKGAPRHLSDGEEQALLAAVMKHGPPISGAACCACAGSGTSIATCRSIARRGKH